MLAVGFSITGGDKLKAHLAKMRANLREAQSVEVGFFPEDVHPKNNIPVASVAFENEKGNPYNTFEGHPAPIPPRPFFAHAIAINQPDWNGAFTAALKSVNYHTLPALTAMGEIIQNQVKLSIESWIAPMNSGTTIALKGFNDPLVETGFMLDHVKFKVQE